MSISDNQNCLKIEADWIDELQSLLLLRRKCSYLKSTKPSVFKMWLRIFKYIISQLNYKCGSVQQSNDVVNLSCDYFTSDLAKLPKDTRGFSSLKIGVMKWITILDQIFVILKILRRHQLYDRQILSEIIIGYIFYAGIITHALREVRLHYYSYVPEMFVASYLSSKNKEINCVFYMHMKFIDFSSSVVCNTLVNQNEISHEFCLANKNIFRADKYQFESSKADLFNSRRKLPISASNKVIGFYSSGFYARSPSTYFKDENLSQWIASEEDALWYLKKFVDENSCYKLIIFPHYARGVESRKSALSFYQKFISDSDVELASEICSLDEHYRINIGIATESHVFWDRMSSGNKALLFNSHICRNFVNHTSLKPFLLDTRDSRKCVNERLLSFCDMSFDKFMRQIQ